MTKEQVLVMIGDASGLLEVLRQVAPNAIMARFAFDRAGDLDAIAEFLICHWGDELNWGEFDRLTKIIEAERDAQADQWSAGGKSQ